MNAEQQRPYYDPSKRKSDRALVVVPEQPRRDCVTWVYNWITKRYEAYHGEAQQSKGT